MGPVHSRMPNDIKLGEQVEEIDLRENAFTATGFDLLAKVVGRDGAMPKLKKILAQKKKDKASDKLRQACDKRGIQVIG